MESLTLTERTFPKGRTQSKMYSLLYKQALHLQQSSAFKKTHALLALLQGWELCHTTLSVAMSHLESESNDSHHEGIPLNHCQAKGLTKQYH